MEHFTIALDGGDEKVIAQIEPIIRLSIIANVVFSFAIIGKETVLLFSITK